MRRTKVTLEPLPIGPDTPLRLETAAQYAFPDGSMSASGLRRERDKGRLTVERIAGKDYTTLNDIQRMRDLCRAGPRERDTLSDLRSRHSRAPGSSGTAPRSSALNAALMIADRLKKGLPIK